MTGFLKLATAAFGASLTMGLLAGGVGAAGTSTTTTTPTPTTCTHTGNDLVEGVTYTTGSGTFTSMQGHMKPGDHLTVTFTVPANCTVVLSLASYQAPAATFDSATASQQVLFDFKDSVSFGAGDNTLAVNIPSCFFQVDFVRGAVIHQLGPLGSVNSYDTGGRLISYDNGGTTACGAIAGNSQTPTPTPTPSGGSVNGISTGAGGVQGITTPDAGASVAVATAALLAVLGLLLVVVGRGRREEI